VKKKYLILGMCSLALITSGCVNSPELQDGQEVVASIDGYTITSETLYDELKDSVGTTTLVNMVDKFIADKEVPITDEMITTATDQVNDLQSQYESMGYDFATELTNAGYASTTELRDEYVINDQKALVAESFYKENLSESAIEDYYNANIYGELTVKHILIKPEVADSATEEETTTLETEAEALANEVITKYNEGIAWADLVTEYSDDDATKENEGLISNFTKDEVSDYGDDFFNAINDTKDDTLVSAVVKSTYGYHVIFRVSQKEKPTLESVISEVKTSLYDEASANNENLFAESWLKIRKSYNLEISDTIINEEYDTNTSTLGN
jgi:foldase protein PrsA